MPRLVRLLPAAIVMIALTVIVIAANRGTLPAVAMIKALPLGDKIAHLLGAAGLSFAVNFALASRLVTTRPPIQLGTLLLIPLVTLEECTQVTNSMRQFDLADLAMNLAGLYVGGLATRATQGPRTRSVP